MVENQKQFDPNEKNGNGVSPQTLENYCLAVMQGLEPKDRHHVDGSMVTNCEFADDVSKG